MINEIKTSVSRLLITAIMLVLGMAYTTLNAQTFSYTNGGGCWTYTKKTCWSNNPPKSQGKIDFSDATDTWEIPTTVSHAADVAVAGSVVVTTGTLSTDNGLRTLSYGSLTVNSTGTYTLASSDALTLGSLSNAGNITFEESVTINGNP